MTLRYSTPSTCGYFLLTIQDHLAGAVEWLTFSIAGAVFGYTLNVWEEGRLWPYPARRVSGDRWFYVAMVIFAIALHPFVDLHDPIFYLIDVIFLWPIVFTFIFARTDFFRDNRHLAAIAILAGMWLA